MPPTLEAITRWATHTAEHSRHLPTLTEDQRAAILLVAGCPLKLLTAPDQPPTITFGPHVMDYRNGTWAVQLPATTIH